jgi:branched-chain amino acid transport system substrate-binding protein
VVGFAVAVAATAAFTSTARSAATAVSPLPSSSCGPIVYKGSGKPDVIIASDLPLQGAQRAQTVEISRAEIWALAEVGWHVGNIDIGYQSCDDSTAQAGNYDLAKCATNGHLYANNKGVIGVLGTFNSACAKVIVPIANRAGPLAMVSPANTNPGITKKWDPGEPQKYYPTGERNYARVVATDDIQGPADAVYAKAIGLKKVYVLNDKTTYGEGVARTFASASKKLGITVAANQGWDPKATSYEALANNIKASGAKGVYLGGVSDNNGAKLIQDIKSVNPKIQLFAPDGFSAPSANGGKVANGMIVSVAGEPPNKLVGAGADFVKSFSKQIGTTPNPYAAYGAQAMQVLLAAIRKGGTDRGAVTSALFGIHITNGIIGTFTINSSGDTDLNAITVYRQQGNNLNPVRTIVPSPDLIG